MNIPNITYHFCKIVVETACMEPPYLPPYLYIYTYIKIWAEIHFDVYNDLAPDMVFTKAKPNMTMT